LSSEIKQPYIALEICADSVESCIEAQRAGAARIELCAGLFEGGLTPSAGCIALAKKKINIPIHVLIRPRGGDFCYSEAEFEIMQRDLQFIKEAGCEGVVIGILKPDGNIDQERSRALIAAARPMSITFHRAFDMTPDPIAALHTLMELGVDRLLTSGQERTALEGSELIYQLVQKAGEQIIIMPGGGITERNIARLRRETSAIEFHLTARKRITGQMNYRNDRVSMGGELRLPEYELARADSNKIASVFAAINAG
jgi:copper homeostasis protein